MTVPYVPERRDLVWIAFDPQAGHEQAGRRPGLVITPRAYNAKARLVLICPVTNQVKGFPSRLLQKTASFTHLDGDSRLRLEPVTHQYCAVH
jgi:mRNA-degrading endonuclease toxin of MazEF toxin-antitoxin module